MELDWKDVESESLPVNHGPVWAYFGGNDIQLAILVFRRQRMEFDRSY